MHEPALSGASSHHARAHSCSRSRSVSRVSSGASCSWRRSEARHVTMSRTPNRRSAASPTSASSVTTRAHNPSDATIHTPAGSVRTAEGLRSSTSKSSWWNCQPGSDVCQVKWLASRDTGRRLGEGVAHLEHERAARVGEEGGCLTGFDSGQEGRGHTRDAHGQVAAHQPCTATAPMRPAGKLASGC